MTDTIQVHGSVILTGSAEGLEEVHRQLVADSFRSHHYRSNALLVTDVTNPELLAIERVADACGARIEQVRDTHKVRVAAEEEAEHPDAIKQEKQPNLELLAGGWYKTNQDAFPLLHVITSRSELRDDGILMWLFEVDMVAGDALPQPATLSAQQLKSYSPKPASLKDFEKLDIVPPAGFEPTPHEIPSVEDDVEEMQEKIAGVPLPQAQMAAMMLQNQLGPRAATTEIVQVPGQGFHVRANLHEHVIGAPDEIAGTPVRYR